MLFTSVVAGRVNRWSHYSMLSIVLSCLLVCEVTLTRSLFTMKLTAGSFIVVSMAFLHERGGGDWSQCTYMVSVISEFDWVGAGGRAAFCLLGMSRGVISDLTKGGSPCPPSCPNCSAVENYTHLY